RNACDRDFAPCSRRTNDSVNFTGKLNSGALAKSKAADVFVKLLLTNAEGKLGRANIARFNQNVADAEIRKRPVIVQSGATEIPEAIFTKDRRIRPEPVFIYHCGRGHDLEGGTRFHHVDDGAVFHFFWFRLGAEV